MRVSDENSSVTKAFHFFTYFNSRLFVHSICTIQSHILKFQPFLNSFAIFHAFNDFFALNDPEIEKQYKWTLKRFKLGMVSLFRPHCICTKVQSVTDKTGCTSRTNWTISFEVWGLSDENSSILKRFKLGMVPSFHQYSMCTKVERVPAKTGCTSSTN